MYRIMKVASNRKDYASLFRYLTTTVDGVIAPLEIETKEELDEKVESMLNDEGYAKSDFIIVQVVDYTIDAIDYTDEESGETSDDDTGEDSGEDSENESEEDSDTETGGETEDNSDAENEGSEEDSEGGSETEDETTE